ncbi:MAG: hypothetical protein C4288_18375 [Leptolyngbya sp. ERB_1_1]|mgnify:CR=1 FL=1
MTITLSQHDYWELFQDIEEHNASGADAFDITWKYPELLDQGYWREIRLREGLELTIAPYQLYDSITLQLSEREHPSVNQGSLSKNIGDISISLNDASIKLLILFNPLD